jgi:hypothetical protein
MTRKQVRFIERKLNNEVKGEIMSEHKELLEKLGKLMEEDMPVEERKSRVLKELKLWLPQEDGEWKYWLSYFATGSTAVLVSALVLGTAPITTTAIGIGSGLTAGRLSNSETVCRGASKAGEAIGFAAGKICGLFSRKVKAE